MARSAALLCAFLHYVIMAMVAADEKPANCGPDQFGLMMDGGSTGSRIHVYVWCFMPGNSVPVMLHDHFFQTKPGLSAYKAEPGKAGASLQPLFDKAMSFVPKEMRAGVPVHFKATAGLRLLPEPGQAEALLESVRDFIATFEFQFEREWVHILDPFDEARYAWVTTNYLQGNLDKEPEQTQGILDLGGGSVQIGYALPTGAHSDILQQVKVGDKTFRLYATSHLGYGLKEARNRFSKTSAAQDCTPPDAPSASDLELNTTYVKCQAAVISSLFADDSAIAKVTPSKIQHNFLIFSYFYDRLTDMGMKDEDQPTLAMIDDVASKACSRNNVCADCEEHGLGPAGPRMCFDATYITTLLHHGFHFEYDTTKTMTIGKQVNGKELGWALGAMIAHMPTAKVAKSEL